MKRSHESGCLTDRKYFLSPSWSHLRSYPHCTETPVPFRATSVFATGFWWCVVYMEPHSQFKHALCTWSPKIATHRLASYRGTGTCVEMWWWPATPSTHTLTGKERRAVKPQRKTDDRLFAELHSFADGPFYNRSLKLELVQHSQTGHRPVFVSRERATKERCCCLFCCWWCFPPPPACVV